MTPKRLKNAPFYVHLNALIAHTNHPDIALNYPVHSGLTPVTHCLHTRLQQLHDSFVVSKVVQRVPAELKSHKPGWMA